MTGIFGGSPMWRSTDFVEFGVRDFLRSILDRETPHAFAVGCDVSLEVAEDVPEVVRAISGAVELLITGFVAQALEKIGAGRLTLQVSFEQEPLPAVDVKLSFDSGGAPAPHDEDKEPEIWSASLMLAATRIAESLGGAVGREVETSGRGALSFRFPVEVVVERSMLQGLLEGPLEAHGVKALVAHQDPGRRVELRLALEDAGFMVTEADNGYQALGLLQQAGAQGAEFDVVLASEGLPGLAGPALAEVIRADPDTGRPPVLVLRPAGSKGRAERRNGSRVRFIPETIKTPRLLLAVQYAISRARRPGTSKLRRRSVITSSLRIQNRGEAAPQEPAGGRHQAPAGGGGQSDAVGENPTVKLSAPVDLSMIDELTAGDDDLVRELAGLFMEELDEQRQNLEDSLKQGDAEAVRRAAHTIKGAAGNFGAERLRGLAAEMENSAKTGDLARVSALGSDLDAAIAETKTWLGGILE